MDSVHANEQRWKKKIVKHLPEFETESGMTNDDSKRKSFVL